MVAGLLPPPTLGNGIATIVNGFGLATPAAAIAGDMPAWVAYCMYQVPIMTIAYLADRKSLLASGYCCRPSAPGSMIPSVKSSFQMVSALTKTGLVHGICFFSILVKAPGWMLSELSCSVSWLNAH